MNKAYKIIGVTLLAASLAVPALAGTKAKSGVKGGGGAESQKGGLPGLEDRVEADEALIAALQAQNNWAVVSSAGTVVRSLSSAGPVTASHPAPGQYLVSFSADVSGCAYEATIGDTGTATPLQGQISVAGDSSVSDVFVQTFDHTGLIPTDSPFHLYVSCP